MRDLANLTSYLSDFSDQYLRMPSSSGQQPNGENIADSTRVHSTEYRGPGSPNTNVSHIMAKGASKTLRSHLQIAFDSPLSVYRPKCSQWYH